MVDREYLERLDLTNDQVILVLNALDKETRFREVLLQEGVIPRIVDKVIRATKLEEVDFSNIDLLREKVRAEWGGFIECQN